MKKITKMSLVALLALGSSLYAGDAPAKDEVKKSSDFSKVYVQIKPRSETVGSKSALSFKEKVGVQAKYSGFGGVVEYTAVQNALTAKVDPDNNRLTQAFACADVAKTKVKVGRQILAIDNHRFIGHVGWRQMMQTFDAATVSSKAVDNLSIQAGYIWNRKGVFNKLSTTRYGSEKDAYGYAKYSLNKNMSVAVYDYYIGGNNSVGAKLNGKAGVKYTVEYANQNGSAHYANVAVNGKAGSVLYGAGAEYQGNGFKTPYATLHKFQGWADKNLLTSAKGAAKIVDISAKVGYANKTVGKALLIYHNFAGTTKANEIDALYVRGLGVKGLKGLVKYANYIPSTGDATQKIIVDLIYNFKTKF